MKNRYKFLSKHKNEFINTFNSLRGHKWSLNFPVYLFDRDWFRLKKVTLYDLSKELKPKKTILTNLHTDLDYEILKKSLPKGIVPAYDGMKFKV